MITQILHFGFSHSFFPVDVTVYEKSDFMRMFPEFRGRLRAHVGVTSSGCDIMWV